MFPRFNQKATSSTFLSSEVQNDLRWIKLWTLKCKQFIHQSKVQIVMNSQITNSNQRNTWISRSHHDLDLRLITSKVLQQSKSIKTSNRHSLFNLLPSYFTHFPIANLLNHSQSLLLLLMTLPQPRPLTPLTSYWNITVDTYQRDPLWFYCKQWHDHQKELSYLETYRPKNRTITDSY